MLALLRADLVILAQGSLYTSTIANLLLPELREAIVFSGAPVLYVANLMTEPGESADLDLQAHLAAIASFGKTRVSGVIVNSAPLPEDLLARYREEGGQPLLDPAPSQLGIPLFHYPLLDPEARLARHHPDHLNHAIREVLPRLGYP